MRVQELMTEGVRTVPPTMEADDARELMKHDRIRHLVVAEGRQIVGLLSDRDIGGRTGSARTGRTVADLMTRNVVTIDREETVRKATNLMRGRTIGCLPVTGAGGSLVGIITTADLLGVLGRGGDRPTQQERRTLNFKVPHRRQSRAGGAW
jgi:CBS-domain-containing membrane protein